VAQDPETDIPSATVVVTTRNRRDELRRMLRSAVEQSAGPEVLVIDDGSDDGTAAMVHREFPEVRLERSESALGLIAQRNRGAEMARAPIIVSIDDDAEFSSSRTVQQTLAEFDDPRIGAVAIPFVNVRKGPEVLQRTPEPSGRWITASYIGTAHAVRREVFLEVGGYRPLLRQQTEEYELCLRLLDAGYVTRLGSADPIHHFESPGQRRLDQLQFYDRRNNLLNVWYGVPMPYLPARLAQVILHTPLLARELGHGGAMARGLRAGLGTIIRGRAQRKPVSRAAYRLDATLRRGGPLRLEDITPLLPLARRRPAPQPAQE
jgi:glycosyltransferase involved in cell wall biosynthesis